MKRRSRLVNLLAISSVLLAPLASGAQSVGPTDQAVTVQINPDHTGFIATRGFKPPIAARWSTDLGATVGYPLIAEGKVFVLARGTGGENLYALDARNGSVLWGPVSVPTGIYNAGSIAYDAGRIFFVPESTPSLSSGAMYAYNAMTGALEWTATLPNEYFFTSPPSAANGIVYVAGAGEGGILYAVDENDGNVLWTAYVENGDNSSPAVTKDGVYVSYAGPQSYKFDPITGTQIWHYDGPAEGGGGSTPVYYDGKVYVRDIYDPTFTHGGLMLSGGNGTLLGTFASGYTYAPFPPAFFCDLGYFTPGANLSAINVITGDVVWSVDASADPFVTAPLVINGDVYEITQSGIVKGYGGATGRLVAMANLGGQTTGYGVDGGTFPTTPNAALGLLVVPVGTKVVALSHGVGLTSITLSPSSVVGSLSARGQVRLNGRAPAGGLRVSLASSNPNASVPASIKIPAGRMGAPFVVTTTPVSSPMTGSILATLGPLNLSAPITVTPIGVQSLILMPTEVMGGDLSLATVTLDAPAPGGGVVVTFTSSIPGIAEALSPTLTIPAGESTGMMTILTADPLVQSTVTIGATVNMIGQSAKLIVDH